MSEAESNGSAVVATQEEESADQSEVATAPAAAETETEASTADEKIANEDAPVDEEIDLEEEDIGDEDNDENESFSEQVQRVEQSVEATSQDQQNSVTAVKTGVIGQPPNNGESHDKQSEGFGETVKKRFTQAKGLAREVVQDSTFLAKKLRVKYGGRSYSYMDNLPPECMPPEGAELKNLIAEFTIAYEKYKILLAKMESYFKTQQSTEAAESSMADLMIDIGMHQQGLSGQAIHAYGIVHREISKKRNEILAEVESYILSPLRSHVEIAMADADKTLKEYQRLQKLCGLQLMRMKKWSEMGFTAKDANSRQQLKYHNANSTLGFYMEKLNSLGEVTETKLRMVESKRHADIARIMVSHIAQESSLHKMAHELFSDACKHNDKILEDGEQRSLINLVKHEST